MISPCSQSQFPIPSGMFCCWFIMLLLASQWTGLSNSMTNYPIDSTTQKDFRSRLIGGENVFVGRVQVFINGEWGTVCSDNWNFKNTDVLCYQLGFRGGLSSDALRHSQSAGPILMAEVKCHGNESHLGECSYISPSKVRDCDHGLDASVKCKEGPLPVRLTGGTSYLDGAVELLYDKRWIPVCNDGSWGKLASQVVCRQLGCHDGFPISVHKPTRDASGKPYVGFDCRGWEGSLAQCVSTRPSVEKCLTAAGVMCVNDSSLEPEDTMRLSHSTIAGSGVVEINHFGEWWPVCSSGWDLALANVACRQLGFQYAMTNGSMNKPKVKHSSLVSLVLFSSVRCLGTEKTLEECTHYRMILTECHGGLAEVSCSNSKTTHLPDFQVRLAGGNLPYEGRVEIAYQGAWGTVCDDSWGYIEADIVCRQLGYYAAESVESQGYFGEGTGAIILDDLVCLGNETSIVDCPHLGIGEHNCQHSEDAGVRCLQEAVQWVTRPPVEQNSVLHLLVILINGLIALLIIASCLIYCSLKMWDKYKLHLHTAHLRQTTQGDIPIDYMDNPPLYSTVLENRDCFIGERSETPPPVYSEAMKLQTDV